MSNIPPNPPTPGPLPGRVTIKVNRYVMPDGFVREKRWVSRTFQAPDGSIQTIEEIEVVPPLSCSCVPEDMSDVALCGHCRALVCASKHAFTCGKCGQSFCLQCRTTVRVADKETALCPSCADTVLTPAVIRVVRRLIYGG